MTTPDEPAQPKNRPMSTAELIATLRAEGRLIERPAGSKGSIAIIGVPMPPPEPPTDDGGGEPETEPDAPKPLKAILGRPLQRPGETKEDAARRLARELFGKVKPSADRDGTP